MAIACTSYGTVLSSKDILCRLFRDHPADRTLAAAPPGPESPATTSGIEPEGWDGFRRDVTGDGDPLSLLVVLAEKGDGVAFARQAAETMWRLMAPQTLVRAVHLALTAGAPLTARQLSAEGHRLYPQDSELAKMARILAPPKVLGTRPARPSLSLDWEWMRCHAADYRGQWVALREGRLLAHAATARELKAMLPCVAGLFVTRIA